MIDSTRELLVGYLLHALEPAEHEQVAEQLRNNPDLRAECQRIKLALKLPAVDGEHDDPPVGLAEKTCCLVRWFAGIEEHFFPGNNPLDAHPLPASNTSDCKQTAPVELANAIGPPAVSTPASALLACSLVDATSTAKTSATETASNTSTSTEQYSAIAKTNWWEVSIAASVLVLIGSVIVPQILQSRDRSLQISCRNNLQGNYLALARYANFNNGRLPGAMERGPLAVSGGYAPVLYQGGFLDHERMVICPESAMALNATFRIPRVQQLETSPPEQLVILQQTMGGTYTYTLGYREQGKYRPLMMKSRFNYALMSDLPSTNRRAGNHHGAQGQNILYEDGHCVFVSHCQDELRGDHFFLNDAGQLNAGLHVDDTVLGESGVGP